MIPEFRHAIFLQNETASDVEKALLELFVLMQGANISYLDAVLFLEHLDFFQQFKNTIKDYVHESADEFFMKLIGELNFEKMLGTTSFVYSVVTKCEVCKHENSGFDSDSQFCILDILTLNVKRIKDTVYNSYISHSSKLNCTNCKLLRNHDIINGPYTDVDGGPNFKIIKINRSNSKGFKTTKLVDSISVPIILSLNKQTLLPEIFDSKEDILNLIQSSKTGDPSYILDGIQIHIGSEANKGHYVFMKRDTMKEQRNNPLSINISDEFFEFNDTYFVKEGSLLSKALKSFSNSRKLPEYFNRESYPQFFDLSKRYVNLVKGIVYEIIEENIFFNKLDRYQSIENHFGGYFEFDDSIVKSISINKVIKMGNCNATLLVYRKFPSEEISIPKIPSPLNLVLDSINSIINLDEPKILCTLIIKETDQSTLNEIVKHVPISTKKTTDLLSVLYFSFQENISEKYHKLNVIKLCGQYKREKLMVQANVIVANEIGELNGELLIEIAEEKSYIPEIITKKRKIKVELRIVDSNGNFFL